MSPEIRLELQQLLSALCDGELTAARHLRLEELLAGDADCRREYLEYMDLHARLLGHPGLSESKAEVTPAQGTRGWWRVSPWLRYAAVAAATVAASLLLQVYWRHPDKTSTVTPAGLNPSAGYVATLTLTTDCEWENPAEKRRAGARLQPGELRLKKGVVQVRFDVGPQLVVEGPATLRLESTTTATLEHGKVVFRTDESAARFDLSTPTATLTDLGTEYAVAVTAEGEEVQVFDGEVERTPRAAKVEPERLKAGQARRYGRLPDAAGEETEYDPTRFVRQLAPGPDPAGGLLAYEGFEYQDADVLYTGQAAGGFGWTSPWTSAFGPPPGHHNWGGFKVRALDIEESLDRPGALVPSRGGRFDCTGFVLFYRRLATPVRLDTDGVYYLSFLFRRSGPTAHPMNSVSVMLRPDEDSQTRPDFNTRLTIGAGGSNQVFTHLGRACARASLPLANSTTYLLVAKIVTSSSAPGQVFVRVYGPREPIGDDEPGSWTLIGQPFRSQLVLEWLGVHVNSKNRQMIDEIRLGTTWQSVTAPFRGPPATARP